MVIAAPPGIAIPPFHGAAALRAVTLRDRAWQL